MLGRGIAVCLLSLLTITNQADAQTAAELRLASELLGERGAQAYAQGRGFRPVLLDGMKSARQGFDQVWKKGSEVLVIEAKGNGGSLGTGYGHAQASKGWTLEVARRTLKRANATIHELKAARDVLKAADRGTLSVEVVKTTEREGTHVLQSLRSSSPQGSAEASGVAMKHALMAVAVAIEAYHRIQRASEIEIAFFEGRLSTTDREEAHAANVCGSIGGLSGAAILMAVVTPQGLAVSIVIGTAGYLIGDTFGAEVGRWAIRGLHATGQTVAGLVQLGWDWAKTNAPWFTYSAMKAGEAGSYLWEGTTYCCSVAGDWSSYAWEATCDSSTEAWAYSCRQADHFYDRASTLCTQAQGQVSSAWGEAMELGTWAREGIAESAGDAWRSTERQAQESMEFAKDKAKAAWSATSKASSEAVESASQAASEAYDAAATQAGKAYDSTARTADRAYKASSRAADDAWKSARRSWKSLWGPKKGKKKN